MKVGTLEIEMLANMARLQKDMNDAKRIVGDAAQSIERYAALAKAALAGISVAGLTALAKGAIDALDAIRDLSLATSINVRDLAGLGVAAKQSGGDLNSIAGAISKLSVNIGKDGERFRALGITAKEPIEAFKQLSDIFVNLKDPQQRAAVMAEALGKSWMGAAPLLAEGGKKIGELVERGSRFSGVTKEAADQADEFNDKLVLLSGTGGLATRMISPLLPLLNTLADDLLKAQEESQGLTTSFNPLLEIGKALTVLFGNVAFVFNGVGKEIGGMAAQIAAFASGDIKGGLAIGKAMKEDAEKARASFDAWEKNILSIGTASKVAAAGVKVLSDEERAAAVWAKYDAEKRAAELAARFLREQAAAEDNAKHNARLRDLDNKGWVAYIEQQIKEYEDGQEVIRKAREAGWAEEAKARSQALDGLTDAIAQRQLEIDTFGMSRQAALEYSAGLLEARAATGSLSGMTELQIKLLQEQAALMRELAGKTGALDALQNGVKQSQDAFKSMYDIIEGGFKAALQGAKSFGDYLKNGLKNALYQLIARPFVIQLAATLTGSSASSVAGALGGTGGGIGSLLGGLGSLSGIGGSLAGGLTSIGLGGAGQFVGGLTGAISGPGLTGAAGAGSSAAGMLSAAGPYVAAAMAAYALYQRFARSGGGAKEGGSFLGHFSSTGTLLEEDPRRFYDSSVNQMDPQMRGLAQGTATSYAAYVRAFGGTARDFTFGFGADTDPRGTAQDRVSATAWDRTAGRSVYMMQNRDVGRNGQIPAELQLESQRALIAALQATEMPAAIKRLFEGVDAMGLTADAANKLLSTATEYAAAIDALKASIQGLTIDGLLAMQAQGESLSQTFQRVASAFSNYENLFVPETERNQKLFDALTDKLKEQNALLPATREGYRALVDAQDLSTESGRALWQILVGSASAANLYYQTIESGTTVVEEAIQLVNKEQDLRIQLMELEGDAAGALEARRAIELATLDAGSRALQIRIYALQDEATAAENTARVSREAAAAAAALSSSLSNIGRGLNASTAAGRNNPANAGFDIRFLQAQQNIAVEAFARAAYSSYASNPAGLADIVSLVNANLANGTMNFGRAIAYASTQGAGAVDALNNVIQANNALYAAMNPTVAAVNDLGNAVSSTVDVMANAIGSLTKYLGGSLLGNLSPLTPEQRLQESQRQYVENLMAAQRGDAGAVSSFGSYRDAYLQEARGYYASGSQYNDIFGQTFNQGAGLTGGSVAPLTSIDIANSTSSIVAALMDVRQQVATVTQAVNNLSSVTAKGDQANVKATESMAGAKSGAEAAVRF